MYLYCLKNIGEWGVVGQYLNSVLLPSGTFYSSSFRDILIAAWGGPLLYIGGFSGAQDLRATAYILFCSEWLNMQFTNLVRQYNIHGDPDYTIVRFIIMFTLHLHTLLTKCYINVYTYIVDDTIDS